MGARLVGDEPFLLAKFPWRKNLAAGRILRRPCFCNLTNHRAAQICPAHVLWPSIRCRVAPGKPISSSAARRNFDRIMKTALSMLRAPDAERYSFHAFRRWASHELKESGPWPVVASSGARRSAAFRGYVDLSRDVESVGHRLFDVDLDSVSEAE